MASGTFQRPMPNTLTGERDLLGLSGIRASKVQIGASKTATFTFPTSGTQDGILVFAAGATSKRGMYIYGCTTTGAVAVTTVLAPTQTGLSVTGSGRTIVLVNGTSDLFACIISFQGSLPTVTQT